jgi:hypothetical protein
VWYLVSHSKGKKHIRSVREENSEENVRTSKESKGNCDKELKCI